MICGGKLDFLRAPIVEQEELVVNLFANEPHQTDVEKAVASRGARGIE
jgi:hypothetical protein